jgi:hypothetical protein
MLLSLLREHAGPFSALGEPVVFSSMLRMLSRGRASATCTHRHTCVRARWLCVCLLLCCIHSACGDYVRQCCWKIHNPDDENTKCYVDFKAFTGPEYIGGFPKMECCGGSSYKGHVVSGVNLWFWCQTCPECTYVEWEYFAAFQESRQVCKALKPCGPGTSGGCEGDCRSCDVGKANPHSDHFCSDCVAGKYAAAQGKLYCDDCAAGHVSGTGWGHCNACEAGKRKVSGSECTPCDAGQYMPFTAQEGCWACEKGKYAATTGTQNCASCPAGSYQDSTGKQPASLAVQESIRHQRA